MASLPQSQGQSLPPRFGYFICKSCGKVTPRSRNNERIYCSNSCRAASQRKPDHPRVRPEGYVIWRSMRYRCYKPSEESYPNYGGRGITVCDRWLNSFEAFIEDMGVPPSPQHSIDRIDNNGNYCPENCRWATPIEQARNKRSNHLITFDGQTRSLIEWAEIIGVNHKALRERLRKGWSIEKALTTPTATSYSFTDARKEEIRTRNKAIFAAMQSGKTSAEIAKDFGICVQQVRKIVKVTA